MQTHPDKDLIDFILCWTILSMVSISVTKDYAFFVFTPITCLPLSTQALCIQEFDVNSPSKVRGEPYLSTPLRNFIVSAMGAIHKENLCSFKMAINICTSLGLLVNWSMTLIPMNASHAITTVWARPLLKLQCVGQGSLIAKLDPADAFCILVHPDDRELLEFIWSVAINGEHSLGYFLKIYIPFGLCSSPAHFLRFADSLAFVMSDRGASNVWPYLDDFWTCNPSTL